MQDLRIVGREAEGEASQLLLSDDAGNEYRLRVDDALRLACAEGSAPKRADQDAAGQLSPRQIQAKLRAGASVEAVVQAYGLSEEHVLRYAGPVTDERAYIASQARSTVVTTASAASGHRMAFGDAPATLEAMVRVRLRAIGVSPDSMQWDAYRREDGNWTISCSFDVDSSAAHAEGIGTQPPAQWAFEAHRRVLTPLNKWAESLWTMSAEPISPSGQARRLAAVEEPFDVDYAHHRRNANGNDADSNQAGSQSGTGSGTGSDPEDLLDILRARRGQRLGTDEDADDKLATMLTRDERPSADPSPKLRGLVDAAARPASDEEGVSTEQRSPEETDAWGFSYADEGSEVPDASAAGEPPEQQEAETSAEDSEPKRSKRSKRPSMPRWDDILFGSKD